MIYRSRLLSRRVAVLAGGQSSERSVSLASGRHVARSLVAAGHLITCMDPSMDPRSGTSMDPAAGDRPGSEAETGGLLEFRPTALEAVDWSGFDLAFLALHGGAGEDGRVQRFFEERQVPFTGPGSASAQTAMSKRATKAVLRAAGLPTPADAPLDPQTPFDQLAAQAAAFGFPVIVKPDGQGSSLGVGLAHDLVELAACRDDVLLYDRCGLIEPFIAGREFTVAVVGRQPLPVLEVFSAGPIFSYAAKYSEGETHCRLAEDLSRGQAQAIRNLAIATAEALDTRGLIRVDLRLDEEGEPWVLELNAIPGLTETSLAPQAARSAGWSMQQLCDHLVRECLDEFSVRQSRHDPISAAA